MPDQPSLPALPVTFRPGRTRAVLLSAAGALALVLLPFDFRQALINSMIGTVMALSLVVITGFVGQISVVQLALYSTFGGGSIVIHSK